MRRIRCGSGGPDGVKSRPETKATVAIGSDQTSSLWQRRMTILARVTYLEDAARGKVVRRP